MGHIHLWDSKSIISKPFIKATAKAKRRKMSKVVKSEPKPVEIKKKAPSVFSSDITRVSTIKVKVHARIRDVCNELATEFPGMEFSILTKGYMINGAWVTDAMYTIPLQEVGGASVDYDQDNLLELTQQGFNTVIHSHPPGCKSFSATDMETINAHFDCSILFNSGEFIQACIPVRMSEDTILQVDTCAIDIWYETSGIVTAEELSRITKRVYSPPSYHYDKRDYRAPVRDYKYGSLHKLTDTPPGDPSTTVKCTYFMNGVHVTEFEDGSIETDESDVYEAFDNEGWSKEKKGLRVYSDPIP